MLSLKSAFKALSFALALCLVAGVLGVGAFGYFLHAHLQARCHQAIQSIGSEGQCRLSFDRAGVQATASHMMHSSGVKIDRAQLVLPWDKVFILFRQPEQKFPFADPLSVTLAGSLARPGHTTEVGFAGNIELSGDGADPRQVDFDMELTGLREERSPDGRLRGSIRRTDLQSSASASVYRLHCDACVFAWGADNVEFGFEVGYHLASHSLEFPLSFSFSSLRLGLVSELGLGMAIPRELAQLSATGNVLLGPDSSLDVTQIKGPIALKPLREMLKSQLAKQNENLAGLIELQHDSLARWFPDEATVTSGSARIDSKWNSQGVAADSEVESFLRGGWDLERHSSLVQLQATIGELGPTAIELWHDTVVAPAASAAATKPKGGLRLSSVQAGYISLDFSLSVKRTGNRYQIEPKFGISDAEVTRLANLWSAKLAEKLGLPGQSAILNKVPNSAEMKSIEKLGKSWLKGFVEREQSSDPARKDAAKEQMRASEKELKEAVRKLLKQ